MAFIGCGIVNIQYIFPFFIPVFSCLRMFSRRKLDSIQKYPLFICIIMLLGEIIGGCFNIIVVFNLRKALKELKKHKQDSNNKMREFTMNAIYQFDSIEAESLRKQKANCSNIHLYFIIFGLAVIESLSTLFYFWLSKIPEIVNTEFHLKSLHIFFSVILCSRFVLYYPVYKHQYLSLGILALGMILVAKDEISLPDWWIGATFWFVYFLLWSVKEVIEKILMEKYYFKPLFIIFVEGLMGLCIVVFIVCIFLLFRVNDLLGVNTSIAIWKENVITVLPIIGYFFGNIGLYICLIITNKIFTPITRTVADSFSVVVQGIIALFPFNFNFNTSQNKSLILNYIGYSLIAIGCLLFNEVIILYFCNLHVNTKKEIIKRGTIDYQDFEEIELMEERE